VPESRSRKWSEWVGIASTWPLILVAGALRVGWGFGLADWLFWLSDFLVSAIGLIPAVGLVLEKDLAVGWMRGWGLVSRRRFPHEHWRDLSEGERALVFLVAIVALVVSGAFAYFTVQRLLLGCTPTGDCPVTAK